MTLALSPVRARHFKLLGGRKNPVRQYGDAVWGMLLGNTKGLFENASLVQ